MAESRPPATELLGYSGPCSTAPPSCSKCTLHQRGGEIGRQPVKAPMGTALSRSYFLFLKKETKRKRELPKTTLDTEEENPQFFAVTP